MKDAAMKNDVIDTGSPMTEATFSNSISATLYCTRYGKPYSSTDALDLKISSFFGVSDSGAAQYNTYFKNLNIPNWKSPTEKITTKL